MTHTHCTLSHTHILAHSHTHTLTKHSYTHKTLIHSQNTHKTLIHSQNTHKTLTHTHTHTHTFSQHMHTHTLSVCLTHTLTLTLTLTHGTQHLLQYRRKLRPLRVQTLDEAVRTVLVDDSQPVSEITRVVCARIGQLQLVSQTLYVPLVKNYVVVTFPGSHPLNLVFEYHRTGLIVII